MAEEINGQPKWYIICTTYGYDYIARDNILRMVETSGLQDYIFDVVVPEEEEVVTPPVEDLTFDLTIFSDVNAEFYMSIVPSDESATYVYAVMTDTDYDDYFPDGISDYFRGRYESSGFDGTFAEYVKSIMNTGPYEGLSSGFYVADDCWYYILIAAGVSINGEDVSFYAPAESSWYEMW